jgi:aspartyl-tRNA(Asn)/glutamyl-tRNA(Gln) amidotransferase subunit A
MSRHSSVLPTLASLADDLTAGRTSAEALTEACLDAINDEGGEGKRAFVTVDREGAFDQARAADTARRANCAPSRYAGIPISIKDLFDVEGQLTKAGATVMSDSPAAETDAPAVARLRRAGFVLIGRTNMSEFAFSGLGNNLHFGTPRAPWDRDRGRVPGGSTSGGAVSVADGMAHAALGTDTGGSCRIPAAFCGLVGYKPTARRVPLSGITPLSPSLDSVGPLARSAACCAALGGILAGEPPTEIVRVTLADLRLAIPKTLVLDGLDTEVGTAFERALSRLSAAGATIREIEIPEFLELPSINAKGGFPAAEAYAWHKPLIEKFSDRYDPRILARILRGREQSATDYIGLRTARSRFIVSVGRRLIDYDAFAYPTVPIVPPKILDVESDEAFAKTNALTLRNPSVINVLDGCAVSLPMNRPGEAPCGLMLAAGTGADDELLQIAVAAEAALKALA